MIPFRGCPFVVQIYASCIDGRCLFFELCLIKRLKKLAGIHDAVGAGAEHFAGADALQFMAQYGPVLSLEFFQDFPAQGIGAGFAGWMLQIAAAVQQAYQGKGTADSAAGTLHIAAAQPEGFSDFEELFRRHIHHISVGKGY